MMRRQKLIRHNRIQQMMDGKLLSDNNTLSYYVRYFESSRQQELLELAEGDDV